MVRIKSKKTNVYRDGINAALTVENDGTKILIRVTATALIPPSVTSEEYKSLPRESDHAALEDRAIDLIAQISYVRACLHRGGEA
jgi:hypothetical protein